MVVRANDPRKTYCASHLMQRKDNVVTHFFTCSQVQNTVLHFSREIFCLEILSIVAEVPKCGGMRREQQDESFVISMRMFRIQYRPQSTQAV